MQICRYPAAFIRRRGDRPTEQVFAVGLFAAQPLRELPNHRYLGDLQHDQSAEADRRVRAPRAPRRLLHLGVAEIRFK